MTARKISLMPISLQRKKEAGYAVGSDAPFGYIRNPVTKRNEIDPETAFYVQLIFQWVLMGVAIFEIARRLTLLKVPTPREWHRKIVEGKEVVTYKKWGETSVRHLPEEVMKLNDIAEMRAGATLGKALQSEYMTVSGTCFINQSSPVMTISKNGIRFSKACHSRLDDCEYVELLYHPILQVVILRKSNHGFSTAMHWRDDNDVHSVFSARAFSGLVFQTLNWKMNYRYQCRGICRGQENAKFLIFELDESRILTGKNQYEQENCSMNLKCRLYRSKWVQSITVNDVMESGQVVENPMIGAIPSKNEVQRELDDLLMSM